MENKERVLSWAALLCGAVCYIFSAGDLNVPVMAWIWPFMLLYFEKSRNWKQGLGIVALVLMIGSNLKWIGLFSAGPLVDIVIYAIMGLLILIPFVADRVVSNRYDGFLSTLAFPLAWVAYDYIKSQLIFASWGSIAYSQYGNLPLMQITSVTGLYGITFLIAWFASSLEYFLVNRTEVKNSYKPFLSCVVVVAAVMACGGMKMLITAPTSETTRVASVSGIGDGSFGGGVETVSIDDDEAVVKDDAQKASMIGARILDYGEETFTVTADHEESFVSGVKSIAKEEDIYILLTMDVGATGDSDRRSNKEVLLSPNGQIAWEYSKTHLVPFIEAPHYNAGDGSIPVLDIGNSRISSVICYDLDYPSYVQKVGASDADILIAPAWDWKPILNYHTPAAEFRAIENGVSFIRNTNNGMMAAVDYNGNTLSSSNTFRTDRESLLISDLPSRGITTVYSRIGDLFDWLCIAGLIALCVGAARKKPVKQS